MSSIISSLRIVVISLFAGITILSAYGIDPTATKYTSTQCEGSLTPYPLEVQAIETPDSLTAVFINHVGRHGSRFPASSTHCVNLRNALMYADTLGTITAQGLKLLALVNDVIATTNGQWGSLNALGMAEQRAIASRMFARFPKLFGEGKQVDAMSSYSPRAMMSMFSFIHQLDRLNNRIQFNTTSGRNTSPLMRPFDVNNDYLDFRKENPWQEAYDKYFEQTCPLSAISRVLGREYPYGDTQNARELAITEYYVIAGLSAMSMNCTISDYFTSSEYNALWSCFNLRQYLQRTASTISAIPAEIASDLVLDLIKRFDEAVEGNTSKVASLRFGHAETLMPLFSLLRLPGCYYITNYFDTVGLHWRDFDVVPMSANLQIVLFKSNKSDRYYVRFDLNEKPIKLPGAKTPLYLPWEEARAYMMRCVPLYAQ